MEFNNEFILGCSAIGAGLAVIAGIGRIKKAAAKPQGFAAACKTALPVISNFFQVGYNL